MVSPYRFGIRMFTRSTPMMFSHCVLNSSVSLVNTVDSVITGQLLKAFDNDCVILLNKTKKTTLFTLRTFYLPTHKTLENVTT